MICYEQLAFVEYQSGDPSIIQTRARFAAAAASSHVFLQNSRLAGLVTRGWQFSVANDQVNPPEAYPATDTPYDTQYVDYCAAIGAIS